MTNEKLARANELVAEMEELGDFIDTASNVWKGVIIKQDTEYIFKSKPYGVFRSKEFNMNTNIKDRVLGVLKDYYRELKKELESL